MLFMAPLKIQLKKILTPLNHTYYFPYDKVFNSISIFYPIIATFPMLGREGISLVFVTCDVIFLYNLNQ